MHLKFGYYAAYDAGELRTAFVVMRELGITWQMHTSQTLYDAVWFWNCRNIPDPLPPYLTELKVLPHDAIGYGLDQADADAIARGAGG